MSADVEVLFLRLQGPLQSWGETARWSVRDTRLEPTKSGVVGLLAACLGWGRDDDARIAELGASLRMGVRVDRPGVVVRDYHTVVGGVMSAQGKIKRNANTGEPETVESWRDYLADAAFLVALEGSHDTLDLLEAALRRPVWPPFLGRKGCPPSAPIYPAWPDAPSRWAGIGLEQALREAPSLGDEEPREPVRAVVEERPDAPGPGGVAQRRGDVPVSPTYRRFAHRYVYETTIDVPRR